MQSLVVSLKLNQIIISSWGRSLLSTLECKFSKSFTRGLLSMLVAVKITQLLVKIQLGKFRFPLIKKSSLDCRSQLKSILLKHKTQINSKYVLEHKCLDAKVPTRYLPIKFHSLTYQTRLSQQVMVTGLGLYLHAFLKEKRLRQAYTFWLQVHLSLDIWLILEYCFTLPLPFKFKSTSTASELSYLSL